MYSFAHLIEFQQEKEEQIVSEPSFSPFQIISRGKKMFWVKFFLPPFPDSIQCLNFAKKLFIQYSIQYCFTHDSI